MPMNPIPCSITMQIPSRIGRLSLAAGMDICGGIVINRTAMMGLLLIHMSFTARFDWGREIKKMRYFSFPIPEFNDWTAIRRAFQVLKKILEETGHSHVWNEIPPEAVENNADYTTVYKFIPN